MSGIDELRLKKIGTKAYWIAKTMNFREDSKDIAQSVVLKYIANPLSTQSVKHAVIDVVRAMYGDDRSEDSSKKGRIPHLNIDNCIVRLKYEKPNQDIQRVIETLDRNDRVIAYLRFVWGMTNREIAEMHNVTEVASGQWVKRIEDLIKIEMVK